MFGEVEGDSTTVSFAYELEVSSEDVDIETEVLPELEQAIIDSILPEAFPDECGADGSKQHTHTPVQNPAMTSQFIDTAKEMTLRDSGMIEPIISTAVTPCVHTEKRKVRVALANTTHSSNAKTADTVGVQMSIKHIRRASGALKCNVSIVICQDSGV